MLTTAAQPHGHAVIIPHAAGEKQDGEEMVQGPKSKVQGPMLQPQGSSLATLRSGDPALQSPLRRAEKRAPLRYEARASLPLKRVAGIYSEKVACPLFPSGISSEKVACPLFPWERQPLTGTVMGVPRNTSCSTRVPSRLNWAHAASNIPHQGILRVGSWFGLWLCSAHAFHAGWQSR